jgi:hypothetical protein
VIPIVVEEFRVAEGTAEQGRLVDECNGDLSPIIESLRGNSF